MRRPMLAISSQHRYCTRVATSLHAPSTNFPRATGLPHRGWTAMSSQAILRRFDNLNVWKKHGERAPHKPLLVLYALGRWQRGLTDVGFREAEKDLKELLREFGPPRKSDHPEEPFWRLQYDDVWTVH